MSKFKKRKSFRSQMIFPFILKLFFSYTTLYLHGLILFTQNEQVALCS